MKPPPPQDVEVVDGYQCQNHTCENRYLVTVLPVVQLAPGALKQWTDLECSSCRQYLAKVTVHLVAFVPDEDHRGSTT